MMLQNSEQAIRLLKKDTISKEKPTFVMLVGLSGSGKSEFAKEISSCLPFEIVSSDAIRKTIFGSEEEQKNPFLIFKIAENKIIEKLNEGKNVVLDATNLNSKKREKFLNNLKKRTKKDFFKQCVIIVAPIDCCVRRDLDRERTVGSKVIKKQMKTFETPWYYEGWDEIDIFRNYEVKSYYYDRLYLTLASFTNNDNPHHSKSTVYDHLFAAGEAMKELSEDKSMRMIARFHDIGKIFTKTFDESGIAHYYNHHKAGAYIALYLDYLKDDYLRSSWLINHHMDFFLKDTKGLEKLYKKVNDQLLYSDLCLLHKADLNAH